MGRDSPARSNASASNRSYASGMGASYSNEGGSHRDDDGSDVSFEDQEALPGESAQVRCVARRPSFPLLSFFRADILVTLQICPPQTKKPERLWSKPNEWCYSEQHVRKVSLLTASPIFASRLLMLASYAILTALPTPSIKLPNLPSTSITCLIPTATLERKHTSLLPLANPPLLLLLAFVRPVPCPLLLELKPLLIQIDAGTGPPLQSSTPSPAPPERSPPSLSS
jgi:hypothetical protein